MERQEKVRIGFLGNEFGGSESGIRFPGKWCLVGGMRILETRFMTRYKNRDYVKVQCTKDNKKKKKKVKPKH